MEPQETSGQGINEEQNLNFESAMTMLRAGHKVGRRQWVNARFVFLVQGSQFTVNRAPLNQFYPEGTEITYLPHIDMCGSDGKIGTWSPSMVDLLAEDWHYVE